MSLLLASRLTVPPKGRDLWCILEPQTNCFSSVLEEHKKIFLLLRGFCLFPGISCAHIWNILSLAFVQFRSFPHSYQHVWNECYQMGERTGTHQLCLTGHPIVLYQLYSSPEEIGSQRLTLIWLDSVWQSRLQTLFEGTAISDNAACTETRVSRSPRYEVTATGSIYLPEF